MKKYLALIFLAGLALIASACGKDISSSAASCAFIIGDGHNGHDIRVHATYSPNLKLHYKDSENARFVPCGPRDYLINHGQYTNANGHKTGDQFTPTLAYNSTHVKMLVESDTYFTLNESKPALDQFWSLCLKYTCASNSDVSGNSNFSTDGWNSLLSENFGPAVEAAIGSAAASFGDNIWQDQTQSLKDQLGKAASLLFDNELRQATGFSNDIFCGSGNSGWDKAHKHYTCSNVRIVIRKVYAADPALTQQAAVVTKTQQAADINAKRLDAAKKLYGDQAPYWLGILDAINACNQKGITCVINLGGSPASPSIPVATH